MNSYWIASVAGVRAVVEGVDERDVWTRVRGWQSVEEPGPADLIYIVHDELGTAGPIPLEALDGDGWPGWRPGPPPGGPAIEPEKPKTKAAAGGSKTEKE